MCEIVLHYQVKCSTQINKCYECSMNPTMLSSVIRSVRTERCLLYSFNAGECFSMMYVGLFTEQSFRHKVLNKPLRNDCIKYITIAIQNILPIPKFTAPILT
ncbi:hypothetical protein SAMN04515618_11415 [Collimonas sp. OK307]|nr:hypothetical protein SAMN04515618_11415 [Collimonas sp. OK307]